MSLQGLPPLAWRFTWENDERCSNKESDRDSHAKEDKVEVGVSGGSHRDGEVAGATGVRQ